MEAILDNSECLWSLAVKSFSTHSYSTVICAPVFSSYHGLKTQVSVGTNEGLKATSAIHCDNLASLPRAFLTDFKGALSSEKMQELSRALAVALDVD